MLSLLPEEVYRDLPVEDRLIYVNQDSCRWEYMKGRIVFPDLDRNDRGLGIIPGI